MKSLLWIALFLLIGIMMFSYYTSSTEQPRYSYGTGESYNQQDKSTEIIQYLTAGGSKFDTKEMISKSNMYSNPNLMQSNNQSGLLSTGLPTRWNDQFMSCNTSFKCVANFSTGWKDDTSSQISTTNNTNYLWSWINGAERDVELNDRFELLTHMKLNEWATQSHVVLEGFNETSKLWYQITQCPSGINGPLEWKEFRCAITIPENVTKIRPVLNAGWSSEPKEEATTWFDYIHMIKFAQFVTDPR